MTSSHPEPPQDPPTAPPRTTEQDWRSRGHSPYTTSEKVRRMLWGAVQATLFRPSFHNWYGWRGFLLRRFGAQVDRTARIRRTVRVECPWNLKVGRHSVLGDHVIAYCLGPVTLGNGVMVSQYSHLCAGTHDHTDPTLPLRRPPITIGDNAWIATDAFVGPDVQVGEGAILGARASAFKDLEPWTIYGGNPARPIKKREFDG